MIKSIGFFINSNGYGHYDRCMQIASHLDSNIHITFYGKFFQYKKIGHPGNATFIASNEDTIRWDKNIKLNILEKHIIMLLQWLFELDL